MKKIIRTIALSSLFAIIPSAATAQGTKTGKADKSKQEPYNIYNSAKAKNNMDKAFEDFIGNKNLIKYSNSSSASRSDDDNKKSSSLETEKLELDPSNEKLVRTLQNAFTENKKEAYYSYMRDAGLSSETFTNVLYGNNLEYRKTYGGYINRNYSMLCLKDQADSLRRYCYSLIWYTDTAKNRLYVILDKFYGPIPEKFKTMKNERVFLQDNDEYINYGLSKKNIKRLKKLLNERYDINQEEKKDTITSSAEFLMYFGNLKNAYENYRREAGVTETSISTILANKIMELCRKYGHLLSQSEKKICVETLKNIQKYNHDIFIKGIFEESIKSLN